MNGYEEMISLNKICALVEVGPSAINGQFEYKFKSENNAAIYDMMLNPSHPHPQSISILVNRFNLYSLSVEFSLI